MKMCCRMIYFMWLCFIYRCDMGISLWCWERNVRFVKWLTIGFLGMMII